MSLLDDVSIVVTPNGYKAGELYAVVPVPTEGADVIVDGDFPLPNVNWTVASGWDIADNEATCSSGNSTLSQDVSAEIGKQYKVTVNITEYTSGILYIDLGGSSAQTFTSTGNKTFYLTTTSTGLLRFYGGSFRGSISNISVKEYTAADMDVTRATAATRVDEAGLVNYAEIVGSEEITDGDFPTGTTAWNMGGSWSIDNNKASATSEGGSIYQNIASVSGTQYKISFELLDYVSGEITVKFLDGTSVWFSGDGSYEYIVTASSSQTLFIDGRGSQLFTGSITNVSVKEVTRDNVPRIDYTGGGCPHILAEPQRRNLLTYSEDFTQSFWVSNGGSMTADTTISPDGLLSADSFSYTSNGNGVYTSGFSANTYTASIYIKKISGNGLIRIGMGSDNSKLDINTLIVTNQGTGVGSLVVMQDGWYRFSTTFTTSSSTSFNIYNINTNTGVVAIWGAQLEVGSYATSYIPNFGTALGVTRNQDQFSRDGISSLINSEEGVLFVEISALPETGRISLSDGTTSNRIGFKFTPTNIDFQYRVGGSYSYRVDINVDTTVNNKIAISFDNGSFVGYLNGSPIGSVVSGTSFSANTLHSLVLNDGASADSFYGKVKQLQVYSTSLSDTQLAALTS